MLRDEFDSDWLFATPENYEPPESDWCEDTDEKIEGYCNCCGDEILSNDMVLGTIVFGKDGKCRPVCICENCLELKDVSEILDTLKLWNWTDDADYVVHATADKAREMNRARTEAQKRLIGTAAKLVRKGG